MTSLATCIRRAGKALNREDADAIREIMAEGGTAQAAVDEYLAVLGDRRTSLMTEIQAAGGEVEADTLPALGGPVLMSDIDFNTDLPPRQLEAQMEFARQVTAMEWAEVKRQYLAMDGTGTAEDVESGRILSVDAAREIYPPYRTDRSLSNGTHEVASAIVKKIYAERLADPVVRGERWTWTAGGTGAGKTTGLKYSAHARRSMLVYDGNLAKFDAAIGKIDRALASGRLVHINYVYRDPGEAYDQGVIKRALEQVAEIGSGRTVNPDIHAFTHAGAREVIQQLRDYYRNDQRVAIEAVDNNNGRGNAALTRIRDLPAVNQRDAAAIAAAELEQAHDSGRIDNKLYNQFLEGGARETSAGEQERIASDGGQPEPGSLFSRTARQVQQGLTNPEGRPEAPAGEPTQPIPGHLSQSEKYDVAKQLAVANRNLIEPIAETISTRLGIVIQTDIKTKDSAIGKANRTDIIVDKDRPWWNVEHERDIFRFRALLSDLTQAEQVMGMLNDMLQPQGGLVVVKADVDKYATPTPWGWRPLVFDIRMPNGQIAEFYMAPEEMIEVSDNKGHTLYEHWRLRNVYELTSRELRRYEKDRSESNRLYQDAYDQYLMRNHTSAALDFASASKLRALAESLTSTNSLSSVVTDKLPEGGAGLQLPESERNALKSGSRIATRESSRAANIDIASIVAPMYSRGDGQPAVRQAELQLALAPAIRALAGTVRVNIAQSTSELPGDAVPTDVEGMYRGGDEVWLVADNLPTAERAKKVFAHETFGHLAMEKQPEFVDVLASVKNLLAMGNRQFTEVAQAVASTQGNLDENTQAKEILAYMAENGIENGTIARAVASVRAMLRRLGLLDGANYSEAEIKDLLVRAARTLVAGAEAKQKALAAMPVQEQILADPNAVAEAVHLAIKEVYASATLMDSTLEMYGEMENASPERRQEIQAAMYEQRVAGPAIPDEVIPEAMYSRAGEYLQIDDSLRGQPPQIAALDALPADESPGLYWAIASEAGTRAYGQPRGSWEERYYTEVGRQAGHAALAPPAAPTEQMALFARSAMVLDNFGSEHSYINKLTVLKNPSWAEMKRFVADVGETDFKYQDDGLRWVRDPEGNTFFWDASEATHAPVMKKLGLKAWSQSEQGAGEDYITKMDVRLHKLRGYKPPPQSRAGLPFEAEPEAVPVPTAQAPMPEVQEALFARSAMKVTPRGYERGRDQGERVGNRGDLVRPITVLKNPTHRELKVFTSDIVSSPSQGKRVDRYDDWNNDDPAGLRWFKDTAGDYYFWDASDAIHQGVANGLDVEIDYVEQYGQSEDIIPKHEVEQGLFRGYEPPAFVPRMRVQPAQRPMFSRYIHPDPEIEAIRARNMAPALEDRTIKDRMRDVVNRVRGIEWLSIKQGLIDSAASVGAIERSGPGKGELLDASTSAYKAILSTRNLGSVMAAIMHRGIPMYQNGIFKPRSGRKGLIQIFEKITGHADGNLLPLWELYAAAYRANRLIREKNPDGTNKEKNFTQAEIDKSLTLGTQYPEFETARKEWQTFNSQLLDLAIKAGVINGEEAKTWRQNDYVPFYRAMEELEYSGGQGPNTGRQTIANVRSGIKRLTGSEAPIGNVFENMVMNTSYLIDAIYRNSAMQRVVAMTDMIALEQVPMAYDAIKVKDGDIARALLKAGLIVGRGTTEADIYNDGIRQVEAMTAEQKNHWSTIFRRVAPVGDDIVHVLQEGKPVYYRVLDPLLLRSIGAMGANQFGGIMNTFRLAKRTLTKAVTIDPAFMMANFIRDTLSTAVVVKGNGVKQITGALKAMRETWNEDEVIMEMMMAGAGGGGYYEHNPVEVRKMLAQKMPAGETGAFLKTILTPRTMWRFWQRIGNTSEQVNRVAIFKKVIAEGGTEAEAAYQARDVLNFTMQGDYEAMKKIVETVPFLNARIQGLYRLARGGYENPIGFAMKGLTITAATMALFLKNQDDDRYKELPEWDKDVYWHFFVGEEHFRLPKPFEVGAIFATTFERMAALGTGEDDLDVTIERGWRMLADTFAFNPVPQLIKPIIEQYSNKNMFTGNPIIGLAHKGLEPEAQYDPWTSETMREMAKVLPGWGGSPKRLEHFLRGYFGSVGMYALAASDEVTRRAFGHPSRPTKGIRNWPVFTRFWRDPNPRTSKYANQLYDMMGEADALYRTMNAYRNQRRVGEAAAMMADGRGKLQARKLLHDVAADVRKINTRIKIVQFSPVLSPADKKTQVDRLNAIKRKLYARVSNVSDIF